VLKSVAVLSDLTMQLLVLSEMETLRVVAEVVEVAEVLVIAAAVEVAVVDVVASVIVEAVAAPVVDVEVAQTVEGLVTLLAKSKSSRKLQIVPHIESGDIQWLVLSTAIWQILSSRIEFDPWFVGSVGSVGCRLLTSTPYGSCGL